MFIKSIPALKIISILIHSHFILFIFTIIKSSTTTGSPWEQQTLSSFECFSFSFWSHTLSLTSESLLLYLCILLSMEKRPRTEIKIFTLENIYAAVVSLCVPPPFFILSSSMSADQSFFIIGHWSSFMFVIIHPVFCYKPLKENVLFLKSFMLFYRMQLPDECVF